ncbi:MAG: response regulator [Bacillota bacterium]
MSEGAKDIDVLLAEDHAVVRAGLRMLINAEPDMRVVGEAENGLQAVQEALRLRPKVAMMDVSMPELNGLEAAGRIIEACPMVNVLILTMHENEEYFFEALRVGALGYVPKSAADGEVLAAIRSVAQGQTYLHPSVAHLLVNNYLGRVTSGEEKESFDGLTSREQEILRLIATGHSNKEIAQKLSLSVHTVHNHRTRLMEKLGVHDRLELLKYAIKKGLLEIE